MKTNDTYCTWKTNSPNPFESFGAGLTEYTKTGHIPTQGDRTIRYALELQKERLRSKALIMKYEFTPRGHFADSTGLSRKWKDEHYTSHMEYRTCRMSQKIYRQNKKIYDEDHNCIFYQTITDANNYPAVEDDFKACPNCGSPNKIKDLETGCAYCGTFFKMSDLFPKTTNYYFIRDISGTEKEMNHSMKKVMIPCILALLLMYIYRFLFVDGFGEYPLLQIIGMLIGSTIGGIVIGYFLYSFYLIGQAFYNAGKSTPMLLNAAGSSSRFVRKMKKYSPNFSYEYFSGKVVSLLKMIIFSENAQELSCYTGIPLGNAFTDIIDSSYSGACALKKFTVQGDYCYVTVDAYMENLYDKGKRIYEKSEKIRVTLCKNINKPINLHFSIQAMQCKSCGSSFDATKQKYCPNCNTPFSLSDEDWVVTKIEKR